MFIYLWVSVAPAGSWFPDEGLNLVPYTGDMDLTTGPPGKPSKIKSVVPLGEPGGKSVKVLDFFRPYLGNQERK